tara:strand:- start:334 stop:963 length:630 start_codon:yes stop_codon:yes gene_type:complete
MLPYNFNRHSMKYFCRIILLLFCSLAVVSQENESQHPLLLQNDLDWGVEHFKLPTGFAQEMTVSGIEEAYFPPGWSQIENSEFWSYLFVWEIDSEQLLDETKLEHNLTLYFNGLMGVPKDTIVPPKLPSTTVVVTTQQNSESSTAVGKVRTFDNFKTKKMMTLHLSVTQQRCTQNGKVILVFLFSPSAPSTPIWDTLRSFAIRDGYCEN